MTATAEPAKAAAPGTVVEIAAGNPDFSTLVAAVKAAGKVMAADVKTGKVNTVNGAELDIKVADGAVTLDGAKVVKTDIAGKNGVIHVIDAVVLPK